MNRTEGRDGGGRDSNRENPSGGPINGVHLILEPIRGLFMHPITLALAIVSVSLNAMAQIALRKTMLITEHLPSGATNVIGFAYSLLLSYWFLAGMTCYAVSIGSWMIVLAKTEVSLAYPLLSIGYIMTAIVGYYFLGENVNLARSGGIALICFGTLLISRSA